MEKLEVGKPFPGPVPQSEEAVMELTPSGELLVLVQLPDLKEKEAAAFRKGFHLYWYWESTGTVPVAFFLFGFPAPMGEIEVSFDAKAVESLHPGTPAKYMKLMDGRSQNMLTFCLLDGQIVQGIKTVGLDPRAVELFHATLTKQLATTYSPAEFDYTLHSLYAAVSSADEFKRMAEIFENKPDGA